MDSTSKPFNKKRKLNRIHSKNGKVKKFKSEVETKNTDGNNDCNLSKDVEKNKNKVKVILSPEEINKQYPILNNSELVKKFLDVPMTNNQKGRIRQMIRDSLKGTTENPLPDVIHGKMQSLIKSSKELTEAELRKIRILFNMLKTSLQHGIEEKKLKKEKPKDKTVELSKEKIQNTTSEKEQLNENEDKSMTAKREQKVKGPKRYVVFVGNLPVDIEKETILQHFADLGDKIVDVRLPKQEEGKKSSIAYVELKDDHSYELALSKHHSMLDNKRINVLYTTQKNSKISKSEAKSTSAKLVALQKSGKLIGSVPLNRKRSHRRNKAKRARAKEEAAIIKT
ncbi:uncharacterized protein LOC111004204 [Pieris rapae]|uniref:uncharacterized protein LOC111004204 n=1 Tax=Pieris rapae TaxID=64459 RepID=UPI001E27E93A|nr:uncharacterized protein LOC111004204 [Pieris rapae]